MTAFTESTVEDAALSWLAASGWQVAHGPDVAPDMPYAERADYGEVVLVQRLRDALARLNPHLAGEALEDAFRKLTRPEGPSASRAHPSTTSNGLSKRLSKTAPPSPSTTRAASQSSSSAGRSAHESTRSSKKSPSPKKSKARSVSRAAGRSSK